MDPQDNIPVLCKKCQKFYGFKITEFLCSKCFKETKQQENKNQNNQATVNKSQPPSNQQLLNDLIQSLNQVNVQNEQKGKEEIKKEDNKNEESKNEQLEQKKEENILIIDQEQLRQSQQPEKIIQENKNICWVCKKKVGLYGFQCKCEYVFCGKHRYPEEHQCTYDFKKVQMDKLKKEIPIIKNDKIQKL